MANDDSAAARAKKAKLEQELADLQNELTETEYDHSITAATEALEQQEELYTEHREQEISELEEYLNNVTLVMTDTFEMIKTNAISIGETITQTANEHGIQISESLTESWKAGENAIASYGELLTEKSSAFIGQINEVEDETWELQEQANSTSESIAEMFANRADNLVSELERSWASEANLNNMTQALKESFVEALQEGYRIGEVIGPMGAAEAATEAVASAAKDAASAFDDMASSARDAAAAAREAAAAGEYKNETITTIYNNPKATQATRNNSTGKITTQSASYLKKKYGKAATGLSKVQKDELYWTQYLGEELIVSPTRNSILTPLKSGDSVIDAKGTKNLFELAKIDPQQLLNGAGANISAPQIESNNSSVQIGTLVNVEGSISDDNLAEVKATIQEELKKTFRNINSGLRR